MTAGTLPSMAEVADAHEAGEAAHDAAGVAASFSENGVLDPKPTGATFTGRAAIQAWYEDLFTAFPDITPELVKRHQDGNTLIDEVIFKGTHQGPFIGIPGTGKPVEVPASVIYEFADGAIIRKSAYWDVATHAHPDGCSPRPRSLNRPHRRSRQAGTAAVQGPGQTSSNPRFA